MPVEPFEIENSFYTQHSQPGSINEAGVWKNELTAKSGYEDQERIKPPEDYIF